MSQITDYTQMIDSDLRQCHCGQLGLPIAERFIVHRVIKSVDEPTVFEKHEILGSLAQADRATDS